MGHKVLIIDDNPAIHPVVQLHMGSNRTDWFSAYDGESGLRIAAARQPDLILLDVDMPGIDGHEVCRRLKADPLTQNIPVVFLSAASSRDDKVLGLDLGAVDYVTKPFDPFELRSRAAAVLRAKHSRDRMAARSMVDELTGLFNRAYLDRQLHAQLAQARRWKRPLACILVEIDDFKDIAREFGHAATQAVVLNAAGIARRACREEDLICRYGESNLSILAFLGDAQCAVDLAERLRVDLGSRDTDHGNLTIRITASCGVATSQAAHGESVVSDAEEALRQAVQAGGDRVKAAAVVAQLCYG